MADGRNSLLLAEELLLLALDDEAGNNATYTDLDPGLGGAILLDLAHRELVSIDDAGMLEAAPHAAPEEAAMARAHAHILESDKTRDARQWTRELGSALKPLRETVAERLVDLGVLGEERHRALGLFPSRRYPQRDPAPEAALRERLVRTLVDGETPSPRAPPSSSR